MFGFVLWNNLLFWPRVFSPMGTKAVFSSLQRVQEKVGRTPSQPTHFGQQPKQGQPELSSCCCPREERKTTVLSFLSDHRLFPFIWDTKHHPGDTRDELVWERACRISHSPGRAGEGCTQIPGTVSLHSSSYPLAAELWKSLWCKPLSSFFVWNKWCIKGMQNCLADRIIYVFTALSTFLLSFNCVVPISMNSCAWSWSSWTWSGCRRALPLNLRQWSTYGCKKCQVRKITPSRK